jgi:superfamily II DNA or RNA helicase
MNINEIREERQKEGVEKWRVSGGRGTLNYETGVGKTHTAFLIIRGILRKHPDVDIRIIVPSNPLKVQWNEKIDEYIDSPKEKSRLHVYGANEVIVNGIREENIYLTIFDEIHEFFSQGRLPILQDFYIKSKFKLGLTATPPENKEDFKMLQYLCPIVDVITAKEALLKGFIAPYIVYNIGISLTPYEQEQYNSFTNKIDELFPYFEKNLNLVQSAIKGNAVTSPTNVKANIARMNGYVDSISSSELTPRQLEINKKVNPYKIGEYAFQLLKLFRERTELLYKAENKYKTGIEILKRFNTFKTICFSESTEFADRFATMVNMEIVDKPTTYGQGEDYCVIYHSNLETKIVTNDKGVQSKFGLTKQKNYAVEQITNGNAKVFVTGSAMDRGLDVPDLRLALIFSRTSTKTQWKQRSGRIKRLDLLNENVNKLVINIYACDTQDEVWLKNSQKVENMPARWVYSIEDIVF